MTDNVSDVELCGLPIACMRSNELLDRMFGALARKEGGWVVTINLDFLRMSSEDPETHALYRAADIRVADGMAVVWAMRLTGRGAPAQIAGSSIIEPIAERASRTGHSLFLLGGSPGTAEKAAEKLSSNRPGLRIGTSCPWISGPPNPDELDLILQTLRTFGADIVLVAFGSPKQEQIIKWLRPHLPSAWLLGVGGSFNFISGRVPRAPVWMQRAGLEWVHRLIQEPRRLAGRYLVHDGPFALGLFARLAQARARAALRSKGRAARVNHNEGGDDRMPLPPA